MHSQGIRTWEPYRVSTCGYGTEGPGSCIHPLPAPSPRPGSQEAHSPLSFSPNMVRKTVKLMGPGASFTMASSSSFLTFMRPGEGEGTGPRRALQSLLLLLLHLSPLGTVRLLGILQGECWSLQAAASTLLPPSLSSFLESKASHSVSPFHGLKQQTNKNRRLEELKWGTLGPQVSCIPGHGNPGIPLGPSGHSGSQDLKNSTHVGTLASQLQFCPNPALYSLILRQCPAT